LDFCRSLSYRRVVDFHGKKLGVLISCPPDQPGFSHGVNLARAAMEGGASVYLYCIDDAVRGAGDPALQQLKSKGLSLYACAYGAHKRSIALSQDATFAGLTVVNDIIAGTDRFVCFN